MPANQSPAASETMNYADYIDSLAASSLEARLSGAQPFGADASSFIKPRMRSMRANKDPQVAVEPS